MNQSNKKGKHEVDMREFEEESTEVMKETMILLDFVIKK